jgi:hypothetical protein
VVAGAGTGKSTVSAALLDGGVLSEGGAAVAAHFLKHSDARRLDPVLMVKSLAFQLAQGRPELQEALFELQGQEVDKLVKAEDAFELLLRPLVDQ